MHQPYSCAIPSRDPTRAPATLEFIERPVVMHQKRFKGRLFLEPVIDLRDYKFRGQIDWIDIKVSIGRPTQFRYVKSVVDDETEASTFITAVDPGSGKVSQTFVVRLQKPGLADAVGVVRALDSKFDGCTGRLQGIEMGVDIFPVVQSEEARLRMLGLVQRMILPQPEIYRPAGGMPRTVNDDGVRFLIRGHRTKKSSFPWFTPQNHYAPVTDATMYLGAEQNDCLIRIEEKVTDNRNSNTGTFMDLEDDKKRVRVEARLKGLALAKLGPLEVDRLAGLKLTGIQGDYLRFYHPTFRDPDDPHLVGSKAVAAAHKERLVQIFLKSGNAGLFAREDVQMDEFAKATGAAKHFRQAGPRLQKRETGTFLAYAEFNEKVEAAIRRLQERERRALTAGR